MGRKKLLARIASVGILCAVTAVSLAQSAVFAGAPSFAKKEEWAVLTLTNNERKKAGLEAVSSFATLENAARLRAEEIVSLFSHTRPDGTDCFTAISDIPYYIAGENIAAGYPTPADVVEGWMNSQGHRENILTPNFKHLGVGYVTKNSGYFWYWSQMFIGGCTTTGISIDGVGSELELSCRDNIDSLGLVLCVTCNMHGKSYLPLENVSYECSTEKIGKTTMKISYDGITRYQPCFVNFSDVKSGKWYNDAVRYVWEHDLFNGTGEYTFEPDTAMTRAMLVTVLYRMEGSPAQTGVKIFDDTPTGKWYSDAVEWASDNDIVNGVGNGKFKPDDDVTREQMAAILHRYSKMKNGDDNIRSSIEGFADSKTASAYAADDLSWAVGHKYIQGKENNMLEPKGRATRAQVATILMRYLSD